MKEFFVSLFSTAQERIKNPFLSSFVFSWIVFNWKAILIVLLSRTSIESRIGVVSTQEAYINISSLLWWPLSCAFIYVFVLPYVMLWIEFLSKHSRELRKDVKNSEIKNDIKRKEECAIEEFSLEEAKSGKKTLEELNTRIKTLEDKLLVKKADLKVKSIDINEKESTIIRLKKVELIQKSLILNIVNIEEVYVIYGISTNGNRSRKIEESFNISNNDLEIIFTAYDELKNDESLSVFINLAKKMPLYQDKLTDQAQDTISRYFELRLISINRKDGAEYFELNINGFYVNNLLLLERKTSKKIAA